VVLPNRTDNRAILTISAGLAGNSQTFAFNVSSAQAGKARREVSDCGRQSGLKPDSQKHWQAGGYLRGMLFHVRWARRASA
jgi:hypothetical protein